MVELIGLLGYYAMVAMTLNAFRMPSRKARHSRSRSRRSAEARAGVG
jgi:hypothetical protein